MLRIYLDQNKWIDLARAATGDPLGEPFRDVFDVALHAVERGYVSFPLDMGRYIETHKRKDVRSRHAVGRTMYRLSRMHTLAPPPVVLPAEIDAAIARVFPVPFPPREAQVFGVGIEHASGGSVTADVPIELPEGVTAAPGALTAVQAVHKALMERTLLLGPVRGEALTAAEADAAAAMLGPPATYARFEEDVAERLASHGFTRGEKLERALWATELRDIHPVLAASLERVGMTFEGLLASLSSEQLVRFLRSIPTREVTTALRRHKHAQRQQRWEANDLVDVVYLPVAAVYCDVVVTEKQWVDRLQRAKVGQHHDTRLLSKVSDLLPLLVGAAS